MRAVSEEPATRSRHILVLKRYALLAGAPVSGSVTLDASGTVGVLHATGKVQGEVRYRGKHAIVSGRERGAKPTPAVVTEDAVPRLPDEMPPIP